MDRFSFWSILAIVFFAELPCLLRTMAIQMHNNGIWGVIGGTMAGNIIALAIGIALAKATQSCLPAAWFGHVERGTAIMLIILGAYLLFSSHHD